MNIARPYKFPSADIPDRLLWPWIIAWSLTTAFFLGLAIFGFYQNHLFDMGAERVQGTVQQKSDQGWVTRYGSVHHNRCLAYTYVVRGVTYSSAEIPVAPDAWFAVKLHGVIPIKYLAKYCWDSRIDYPGEDRFNRLVPTLPAFLGILTLFFGIIHLNERQRRLKRPPHIT